MTKKVKTQNKKTKEDMLESITHPNSPISYSEVKLLKSIIKNKPELIWKSLQKNARSKDQK